MQASRLFCIAHKSPGFGRAFFFATPTAQKYLSDHDPVVPCFARARQSSIYGDNPAYGGHQPARRGAAPADGVFWVFHRPDGHGDGGLLHGAGVWRPLCKAHHPSHRPYPKLLNLCLCRRLGQLGLWLVRQSSRMGRAPAHQRLSYRLHDERD